MEGVTACFSCAPGQALPRNPALVPAFGRVPGKIPDHLHIRPLAARYGQNRHDLNGFARKYREVRMVFEEPGGCLVRLSANDHVGSHLVITHRHFRRADRDEAPDFRAPLPGSPISESMCAWIALICSA